MAIKYIFFDVSGTILGKPSLFEKIQEVLERHHFNIPLEELKLKHKLLSEVIHFPDRTDHNFYNTFNSELLFSLGIVPEKVILDEIFNNCTYLPWEKYEDTDVLNEIEIPMGIISNFNTTLKEKINQFFGSIFQDIYVSEELGVAKPKIEFYQEALKRTELHAEEVLYIGDSIKLDIKPAESLGIQSLLIDREGFYKSSKQRIASLSDIKKYI